MAEGAFHPLFPNGARRDAQLPRGLPFGQPRFIVYFSLCHVDISARCVRFAVISGSRLSGTIGGAGADGGRPFWHRHPMSDVPMLDRVAVI